MEIIRTDLYTSQLVFKMFSLLIIPVLCYVLYKVVTMLKKGEN